MSAKITCMKIEGRSYNVAKLVPLRLAEFVVDVEKADTTKVCKNYGVTEVK